MKSFYRNPHIYLPFLVTCILAVIALFMWYVEFGNIQDRLVLHQNIQGEINLTGYRGEVLLVLIIALIFFLTNMIVAKVAYGRERLLSYILAYINTWTWALALIYVASISGMN